MSNTIVNTNVSALNSHRAIQSVSGRQARSSERLSSGMRINRAADDAAGLAISEKMRNQIRGLDQATRNSQDGISLVQTAEGALEEVQRILERMRELTNQAANDTNESGDRANILIEIQQISAEINQTVQNTEFNGMRLLGGNVPTAAAQANINTAQGNYDTARTTLDNAQDAHSSATSGLRSAETNLAEARAALDAARGTSDETAAATAVTTASNSVQTARTNVETTRDAARTAATNLSTAANGLESATNANTQNLVLQAQSGANAGQRTTIQIDNMSLSGLGLQSFATDFEAALVHPGGVSGGGRELSSMINTLDDAINTVSAQRANLGAVQNRLEHTINNLRVSSENLSASNSRIRDTDMAAEMMALTQANVLQQAGMSMLSQANQSPQNVLQLLG